MSAETALAIARWLIDQILSLIPHGVARDELDAAAIRRSNAIADDAESVKFRGNP